MRPPRTRDRPRLTEQRLLVRRTGVRIFNAGRQRAGFKQGIADRLGMRRIGQKTNALPSHRSELHFALVGEFLFKVVNARTALDKASILHQFLMQGDVGLDTLNAHL